MTKDIAEAHKKLEEKKDKDKKLPGRPTPWPAEARPNPYLKKAFTEFNTQMSVAQTINVLNIYDNIYYVGA